MAQLALALVLVGSVMHLAWNLLLKNAQDKSAFLWLAIAPVAVCVPVVWVTSATPAPPQAAWLWIGLTVAVHVFYFLTLGRAYGHAHLSLVYPYSRAIGALGATLGGMLLLGDRPSALGAVGVALTLGGTVIEPLSSLRHASTRARREAWAGLAFTVLTGISIAAYMVIDTIGLQHMPTLPFLGAMVVGCAAVMAWPMLASGRARAEWKRTGSRIGIATALLICSYALVLEAMRHTPVTYVVAVRSSGIALSGIAGLGLLQEHVTPSRWVAIAL
ncbi:MAG: EamA family transporter, partial [Bdellovibrionales bacterium]|nr:EamA family transporter [Bdellovibrionales bacterium]